MDPSTPFIVAHQRVDGNRGENAFIRNSPQCAGQRRPDPVERAGIDPKNSAGTRASAMLKILFLCTGNSCRSQMAEGWARHLKGDRIKPYSAGIETHGLNPVAVKVMAEAGVDISGHRSKHVDELGDVPLDHVATVCGDARESCPAFPGATKVTHAGFDDPPACPTSVSFSSPAATSHSFTELS
jgi:arsenate reductase